MTAPYDVALRDSALLPRRRWFDEDGTPLWECNDCGVLITDDRELCGKCQEYEDDL